MNRNLALCASLVLVIAAAGHARADDITIDDHVFVSTATRADVLAQLQQFRASGIDPWAENHNPLAQFRSTRTREEVMAEFFAERELVAAQGGEDSGAMYVARRQAPRMPRVQVATQR